MHGTSDVSACFFTIRLGPLKQCNHLDEFIRNRKLSWDQQDKLMHRINTEQQNKLIHPEYRSEQQDKLLHRKYRSTRLSTVILTKG